MAAKNGGKTIFAESRQYTLQKPVGQNFRRNCSISHRFWDIKDFSFSGFRKIVLFSLSLINRSFWIRSFPKVNDFLASI